MSIDHITDAPHDETMADTIVLDSRSKPSLAAEADETNDSHHNAMIPSSDNDNNTLNSKPFVCNTCKNSFSRIDHLARHYRSHTNKKPHRCDTCNKAFSRMDLLSRHQASHERNDSIARQANKKSTTGRARACKACVRCAEAKLRCEGVAPCERCRRRSVPCLYENSKFKLWDFQSRSPVSTTAAGEGGEAGSCEMLPAAPTDDVPAVTGNEETDIIVANNSSQDVLPGYDDDQPQVRLLGEEVIHQNYMMDFEPSLVFDNFWNSASTPSTSSLGNDNNSFAEFLNGITANPAMAGDPQIVYEDDPVEPSPSSDPLDAYQNSFWPENKGESLNVLRTDVEVQNIKGFKLPEAHHLLNVSQLGWKQLSSEQWSQPPSLHSSGSFENLIPPSRWPSARSSPRPVVQASTRHRLIATILPLYNNNHLAQILSCFPSIELLNNLINNYFACVASDTDSWLHATTFDPNNEIPVLLLSVITAGALQPNVTELKPLGLAFWEINFSLGSRFFSEDNRTTELLSHLQALALELDLGLWSGDRRIVEMSECLSMSGVTMARRARFLTKQTVTFEPPQHDDSPEVTAAKWHRWINCESSKRLASHLLIRDAQSSTALLQPPILCDMEISLPLPACRNLWLARSAEDWKRGYLGKHARIDSLPALNVSVNDFASVLEYTDELDTDLTALVILSALVSQTFHYSLRNRARKYSTQQNSDLLVSSLYQENVNRLESFKASFSDWGREGLEPAIRILYERQLMNMHACIEDLQFLAGKEGATRPQNIVPELAKWMRAKEGRLAVWHAGQILAAAKGLRNSTLREGSAVAIVHAALVLWAFGILSDKEVSDRLGTSNSRLDNGQAVVKDVQMNGPGGAAVQQFLLLARGRPFISSWHTDESEMIINDQNVPLHCTKIVVATMVEALHATHASARYDTVLLTHLSDLIQALDLVKL